MTTESNYRDVVRGIAAQLSASSLLTGVRVLIDQDPVFGLPDDGGRAIVVEPMRRRPSSGQSMAAGRRLRSRFSVVISAVGFDLTSYEAAAAKRDDMIDKIEQAIMTDRSISNTVANLEIQGGDFYRASVPGNSQAASAVAETILEMDVSSIL